ncbi:Glycolipid transfer protein 3 [Heracleum sosnowskyi]|uniref:Glycolipid transfer protein 3 n=1 Tax=Heracleum sosnowskyi TaxID=360622 RepID=A0AAD8H7Z9_9APIA|nr:Glycolipid transfer protein 3 [Heracleum sosnowskyi]
MKRRREMEMELKMRSELRSAIEEFSKEVLKVQPVDDQVQNAAAHIPLKPFLFLCNMVLQVLDKIGPTMAVLRHDIHQNIQRLEKFQESNPSLYSNVVEILKKEKNEVSARHVASCSRAFVWLTRSLDFTVTLLRLLLKDSELKMEQAVEEAYIITLKPWHGWITSTAYKVALKLVPDKKAFLTILMSNNEDNDRLEEEMETFILLLVPFLDKIHSISITFKLDNMKSP